MQTAPILPKEVFFFWGGGGFLGGCGRYKGLGGLDSSKKSQLGAPKLNLKPQNPQPKALP